MTVHRLRSARFILLMELLVLHKRLRATMIYVTCDQIEAMTLVQRFAVFDNGEIQQLDADAAFPHRNRSGLIFSAAGDAWHPARVRP